MSDGDDTHCGVNRVRQMARMFDALALAEADGTARQKPNTDSHNPSILESDEDCVDAAGVATELAKSQSSLEEPVAHTATALLFTEADVGHRSRHDTTTDEHDQGDRSHVRRLTSAFERLAQTSQSSQLHLVDGQRRELMYVSLRSLHRRCSDELLRSDLSSDVDEVDDNVNGDAVSDDVVAVVGRRDLGNAELTNKACCSNDMEPRDTATQLRAFYADLERTTEHAITNRRSVAVDLSAFCYGPSDRLSLAEFYSDLERLTDDVVPRVVVDYSAMDYMGSDDVEQQEPINDARNYQLYDAARDNASGDSRCDDDSDFATDFSDTDNESADDERTDPIAVTVIAEPAVEATESMTPVSKVPHIIDEILTNEQNYIKTLSGGIHVYMSAFDESFDNNAPPVTLLGQKYHLFGNIERIRDFHANTFYPALQDCDPSDVRAICETFCRFCTEHRFYMYVLYAINSKHGDWLASQHRDFFAQRQLEYGDRLGLNSFLLQPIQRLPRYQLLLRELIKELAKYLDVAGIKEQIASCCRAEKHLQRLLDQVNSSMTINDVVDNVEINLLHQGRFRFVHEFDVYECDSRRRYAGKLFLFDGGVLVTEVLDRETLQYRGFYTAGRLGMQELDHSSFALFDQYRNVRQVELATEANAAALWMQSLEALADGRPRPMAAVAAAASTTNLNGRRGTFSAAMTSAMSVAMLNVSVGADCRDSGISADTVSLNAQQQLVVVRNGSHANGQNAVSNAYSSGVSGMSDNSSSSYDSDSKRTTWYTNVDTNLVRNGKTLERLLNSEKHFIQILSRYHRQYLGDLPRGILARHRDALRRYTATVRSLIDYHHNQHYPQLLASQPDIVAICDAFAAALATPQYMDAYQSYAATCTRAYAALDTIFADGGGGNDADAVVHYTNVPLEHLDRTYTFMDHLMCELKNADETFVSDEFKAVARLGVELNRFRLRVRDNRNLYAMKNIDMLIPNLDDFGMVECSESCFIYTKPTRLLLLSNGLVCVGTKTNTKTQREKFTSVEFYMLRSAVRTTESNQNRARLKFFSSHAKEIEFKVNFATEAHKLAMQKRIDVFSHMQ